jgi:surfeit locus 1 family protein
MMRRWIPFFFLALLFICFIGLGAWQVERLTWKLDLIATVDQRVHAAAVAAPVSASAADVYRKVSVSGTLLNDRETFVQAVTELGPGFWVMTPLRRNDGTIFMINRGFVPGDRRDGAKHSLPTGEVTITGLVRLSEPKGGFLRANDPAADRWYSRDVAAIAAFRQLGRTADYFIDADSTANAGGYPVGGLTVIRFANNHLSYALTWFGMALMTVAGGVILFRRRGSA